MSTGTDLNIRKKDWHIGFGEKHPLSEAGLQNLRDYCASVSVINEFVKGKVGSVPKRAKPNNSSSSTPVHTICSSCSCSESYCTHCHTKNSSIFLSPQALDIHINGHIFCSSHSYFLLVFRHFLRLLLILNAYSQSIHQVKKIETWLYF